MAFEWSGAARIVRVSCAEASSLVTRLCYDRKPQYLLVSLKGVYYHYCEVEPQGDRIKTRVKSIA